MIIFLISFVVIIFMILFITNRNFYYFNITLKNPKENFAYIISKLLQKKYDFFKKKIGIYKFKYTNNDGIVIYLIIESSDKISKVKLIYDNIEIASWFVLIVDDIFNEIKCHNLKVKSKILFNSENININELI